MEDNQDPKSLEAELLTKVDSEKQRADNLQKELEEFKTKGLNETQKLELELTKLKEQNSVYDKKFQEIAKEKEVAFITKEYPDIKIEVLKGSIEEMKAQAKLLQDHINKAREDANAKIAKVLGTSTVSNVTFNNSDLSPDQQAKIRRQNDRNELIKSGPKDEESLAIAILNTKMFPSVEGK